MFLFQFCYHLSEAIKYNYIFIVCIYDVSVIIFYVFGVMNNVNVI